MFGTSKDVDGYVDTFPVASLTHKHAGWQQQEATGPHPLVPFLLDWPGRHGMTLARLVIMFGRVCIYKLCWLLKREGRSHFYHFLEN